MGSALLAFNTVERLLRGDFFHTTSVGEVRDALAAYPADWTVVGLGTTNWRGRHGELLVDGTAGAAGFTWIDPLRWAAEPLDLAQAEETALPFAAVAVCDPGLAPLRFTIGTGEDVFEAVAAACREANIGLAALRLQGMLGEAEHQVMCEIPLGGVRQGAPAVARRATTAGLEWDAVGFYAANPTIQTMLAHGRSRVHLHGRASDGLGGHLNWAGAVGAEATVWPVDELALRIRGLGAAVRPLPQPQSIPG